MENSNVEDLVCPLGKKKLVHDGEFLLCVNCGVKFYIENSIPVLLMEKAVLPEGIKSISGLNCMKK